MSEPARGLVFVLSGPAGVGKDAVLARLLERGVEIGRVVTAITRPPRPGEVEGRDYYFVTRERFMEMVAAGELLEWADYVGSPRGAPVWSLEQTLRRGRDAILKIDVEGARQVRARLPAAITIFLEPPNLQTLLQRMAVRGHDDRAEIQRRLRRAEEEMALAPSYDYRVVNREGELERAVGEVEAIIAAERARVPPRIVELG
ncbi:MAG TPA: guanylate kinase [Chloroflexota bacterium]|jgi:guanylate kinase